MKKLIAIIGSFLVLTLATGQSMAQCAMCRATLENNVSEGSSNLAAGFNVGILYLMLIPYLALVVIGVMWYRHSKKYTSEQNRIARMLNSKA
ncbi:hypothetical protein AAG747_15215 [Rapidithrix thailandica]|uniref:Uncharacterized protein n=1 Tax=Rapidithrix thailandica TaxID=413964 RepID=A0AAW9RZP5_9BACT